DRAACMRDNVPMGSTAGGALVDDLAADTLPSFSFITPDLCDDTHDCSVTQGDRWLADWMPRILKSAAYRSGRTAVFITYDDYTPVPNVVIAPSVQAATVVDDAFDHYSLLRTTEEMLGLTPLLGAATEATSMRGAFQM